MGLSILVCYYSKDFSSNENDKFPHIALARAQDDSKGLGWIINFTCPENQRVALFTQRIYLFYSDKTSFRESSHTTHLVLTWKILFLHTFQENSVAVNTMGLRNFDFPTMKTFKAPRVTLTSQNGYLLQFSYWLKTRIMDLLIGTLMSKVRVQIGGRTEVWVREDREFKRNSRCHHWNSKIFTKNCKKHTHIK